MEVPNILTKDSISMEINRFKSIPIILSGFFFAITFTSLAVAKKTQNLLDGSASVPTSIVGHLTAIKDGTTFDNADVEIRLWGLSGLKDKDPYFYASKLYLETILKNEPFECFYKATDTRGRLLAICYSEGFDIGADILRRGLATVSLKGYDYYFFDQEWARTNEYGIWSTENNAVEK